MLICMCIGFTHFGVSPRLSPGGQTCGGSIWVSSIARFNTRLTPEAKTMPWYGVRVLVYDVDV